MEKLLSKAMKQIGKVGMWLDEDKNESVILACSMEEFWISNI